MFKRFRKPLAFLLAVVMTVLPIYSSNGIFNDIGLIQTTNAAEDNISFTAISGTASVRATENYEKLVDGKYSSTNANDYSKWCVENFSNAYIIFSSSEPIHIKGYSIVTGNDNQTYKGRNPKDWKLYGCNDESADRNSDSWEEIHSVTNDTILKDINYTKYDYTLDTPTTKKYQYFKLEITALQSDDTMQMSEFILQPCQHNWIVKDTVSANCTTAGYEIQECSLCTEEQTVPDGTSALGHNWIDDNIVAPTCTNEGYTTQICSRCQETRNVNITSALGHSYADGVCSVCKEVNLKEPAFLNGYYQISNVSELYWFAGLVTGTLTDGTEQNTSANAVLTADIVVNKNVFDEKGNLISDTDSLLAWTPISGDSSNYYTGIFDGQNYTISGLYFNDENAQCVGLFNRIESSTIRNLGVINSYFNGNVEVGSICGYSHYSTIENCYSTGTVNGSNYIGGICGRKYYGTITNCFNNGKVTGTSNASGICGFGYGEISNCYNTGIVNGNAICARDSYLKVTNSYYLEGTSTDSNATAKTAEQFASGEVCYLLSNGNSNSVWGQIITGDNKQAYPTFNSTAVYYGTNCKGENLYSNEPISSEHDFTDNNGFCKLCGSYETPTQNSEGAYEISNAGELYWFVGLVNNTLTDGTEQNTSANAVLTADIVVNKNVFDENGNLISNTDSLLAWMPIVGDSSSYYTGIFDGQNHTISGLYFNDENAQCVGLFNKIESSTIRNLGVINSYFNGNIEIGSICGYSHYSTIENCYSTGTVNGNKYIGGICGRKYYGTITNCFNNGKVTGTSNASGICGFGYGEISNCYNAGIVNGNAICEWNGYLKVTNSYYLEGTATDSNATVKTAEQFASGEVCYLLSKGNSNSAWGQIITGDNKQAYPTFNSTAVYYGTNCKGENLYSNEPISSEHDFTDNNGFCKLCGSYETPTQNSEGAYEISNAGELYWFAGLVNGTLTDGTKQNISANAVLTADIVVNKNVFDENGNLISNTDSLLAWIPISGDSSTAYVNYIGTFDGQNHTISGLYFNNSNTQWVGLFGKIGLESQSSTIRNLGVIDSYFNGNVEVSSICGYSYYSTIENCYSTGTVNGSNYIGGICGRKYYGTITNCFNNGKVTGTSNASGICGFGYGEISNCYNTGVVNGNAICENNKYLDVSNCYYLEGTATGSNATVKTAEQFANGQVCYLLNNGKTDGTQVWYQTIDTDTYPLFEGATVFYIQNANPQYFNGILGDVNNDKIINNVDAALTLNHISGISSLDEKALILADVNNDNKVDILDVIKILNLVA
ncbi:MAG: dockerin type I repeat-containing protein [Lachnospirales bacterium]